MSLSNFKKQGDAAFKAGNYQAAIDEWSKAINVGGGSIEESRSLLSNRSAAYNKLRNFNAALVDAEKCCNEIDKNWSKGYVRKGEALQNLLRLDAAIESYKKASSLDSSLNTSMNEKITFCQRLSAARNQYGASWSSSGGVGNSIGTSIVTTNSLVEKGIMFCRIFMLINAMLVFLKVLNIPLIMELSLYSYFRVGAAASLSYVIMIYRAYGMPKFSQEYAQKLLMEPKFMYFFLACLVMGTSHRSYSLAIQPLVLMEGIDFMKQFCYLLPSIGNLISTTINTIVGKFQSGSSWIVMSPTDKWNRLTVILSQLSAKCEVYQGIYLIVEIFTPRRNLLLIALWWQYLQIRYISDTRGYLKAAMHEVDSRILTLVNHQYCPNLIKTAYMSVRAFLAKRSDPRQMQQAAESNRGTGASGLAGMAQQAMSGCNVM